MGYIKVIDHTGVEQDVSFKDGDNLMDLLDDAELPLRGDCGGLCACVTCHVYISYPWSEAVDCPDQDETIMIDQVEQKKGGSRLACEITLYENLSGATISFAPGSEIEEN